MRLALGQINTTVGDMTANVDRMIDVARQAAEANAEAVVFPELAVTGYPPRDLMEKPAFLSRAESELTRLAASTASLPLAVIAGSVAVSPAHSGKRALNI